MSETEKHKLSEARLKANDKYIKNTFDEIKVRVSKGQKEIIQSHAETRNESLNGFVKRAISEAIQRDNLSVNEK